MKKSSNTYFTIFLAVLAVIAAYMLIDEYYGKPTPDHEYTGNLQSQALGFSTFDNNTKPIIYLFFDYACEFCKENLEYLSELPNKTAYEYSLIQVPLPLGLPSSGGYKAAAKSICYYNEIKSLKAHTLLLNSQNNLGAVTDKKLLRETGLRDSSLIAKYQQCIEQKAYKSIIDKNRKISRSMNITSVPALSVKGEIYIGAQATHRLQNIIAAHLE